MKDMKKMTPEAKPAMAAAEPAKELAKAKPKKKKIKSLDDLKAAAAALPKKSQGY